MNFASALLGEFVKNSILWDNRMSVIFKKSVAKKCWFWKIVDVKRNISGLGEQYLNGLSFASIYGLKRKETIQKISQKCDRKQSGMKIKEGR